MHSLRHERRVFLDRFPEKPVIDLTTVEWSNLTSQIAISSSLHW